MIISVSILTNGRGAAIPLSLSNFCIFCPFRTAHQPRTGPLREESPEGLDERAAYIISRTSVSLPVMAAAAAI